MCSGTAIFRPDQWWYMLRQGSQEEGVPYWNFLTINSSGNFTMQYAWYALLELCSAQQHFSVCVWVVVRFHWYCQMHCNLFETIITLPTQTSVRVIQSWLVIAPCVIVWMRTKYTINNFCSLAWTLTILVQTDIDTEKGTIWLFTLKMRVRIACIMIVSFDKLQ